MDYPPIKETNASLIEKAFELWVDLTDEQKHRIRNGTIATVGDVTLEIWSEYPMAGTSPIQPMLASIMFSEFSRLTDLQQAAFKSSLA